jgi:hypothetical protein
MKKYLSYLIVSLLAGLIVGCAQWGGDNPLGITGGGKEGYGQNNDLNLPEITGKIDPALVGVWRTDESYSGLELTLNADGSFTAEIYIEGELDEILEGTWGVSGENLLLTVEGDTIFCPFTYYGNSMTISYQGDTIILYRRLVIN